MSVLSGASKEVRTVVSVQQAILLFEKSLMHLNGAGQ